MTALRERLRDQPLPGEAEAEARSWPVVQAALAERAGEARTRGRAPRRRFGTARPVALRLALLAVLAGALLAAALSPAGAAVGDWIGDRFAREDHARPAFAALPEGQPVLAISRGGAYVIRPENTRRLGSFSQAGWSPHGLHVVGVQGRRVIAVTQAATVKWTLVRPHAVHDPAWSNDEGFRVAYLEGATLRVVVGNGDPATDHPVGRRAAAVTPAWLPHSDRWLTYAKADGAIETVDVDSGRVLWRSRVPASLETPGALAWSSRGDRLVALSSHSVSVLDRHGRVHRTIALPGVARELALAPSGDRMAVVLGNRVVEIRLDRQRERVLFQGTVDGVAWSQDGRRLLVGWQGADQWLILGPGRRVRALHGVTGELGAAGGFPRVAAWCCSG
jgi:hypothetical protein